MSDDAIISFAQRLREREQGAANNFGISTTSPEAAGRANVLARQMALPADFVDRNLNAIERQALEIKAREAIRRYAPIGVWGSDPRNAAMASDDLQSLQKIAKTMTRGLKVTSFTSAHALGLPSDQELDAATRTPGAIIASTGRMRSIELGLQVRAWPSGQGYDRPGQG
jgi:hypothetical protein